MLYEGAIPPPEIFKRTRKSKQKKEEATESSMATNNKKPQDEAETLCSRDDRIRTSVTEQTAAFQPESFTRCVWTKDQNAVTSRKCALSTAHSYLCHRNYQVELIPEDQLFQMENMQLQEKQWQLLGHIFLLE